MEQTYFQQPLISVITVCYNSAATIRNTVESVLNQTYGNFEYIVVDGKSKDHTVSIVEEYKAQFGERLRIICEPDTGIYNAMNKGIAASHGQMIGIVNSDDQYAPDTLATVAERYEKEQYPYLILNGDMTRISEQGDVVYRYRFSQENIDRKEAFGHPAMFAAKAVYDLIGLYDESYKLAADGDWQYRAFEEKKVRYVLCSHVFNYMREGGASDNHKYRWKWFHERVRMKRSYHKDTYFRILVQELWAVVKTDIKCITPVKVQKELYKLRYRK